MLDYVLKLFLQNGSFVEAVNILKICRTHNLYSIGVLLGNFLSEIFPTNVELLTEYAFCALESKKYSLGYSILENILSLPNIPIETAEIAYTKQRENCAHIADTYTYYNPPVVKAITTRKNRPFPLVTFSITTCKRYDLFEKTMNSFLNCCTDLNKIDKWLCVDDNSSEEDREKMKVNYPFFQFYFKTKAEKGHPRSMNIIRDTVKTPYIFHMEDDWKFFARKPYISLCMSVLSQSYSIGQCLINKNYAETEKSVIVGGHFKQTMAGEKYFIHEFCSNPKEQEEFNRKYNYNMNCAYWPHFSFRPSLVKTSVLHQIGKYNESVVHFEMDYSNRYVKVGFISAFLGGISCLHTGRLTSERHDKSKPNAYDLNEENQFYVKEEKFLKESDKVCQNIKTFVINLNRRPDRWESFCKQEEPKFLGYERYQAVDGSKLKSTEQLQRIFDGNDYNMREGMVGCALSHIDLYVRLLSSEQEAFCILEDDITFVPDFKDKFLHLYKSLPTGWDMCYLGHHLWKQYRTEENYDKKSMPVVELWDSKKSLQYSIGGTGGYLISKKGAEKLLEFINTHGMTNAIDTMQQKAADSL